ncbi:riboflavin synthase [Tahibacter harae]|uniref:Riboflavin synthase n=1 Tax=Tahibacter harae TaxID=2963937 RepID=A0ABT1QQ08_9GAMM|nr:riboflavin synthase [Tahibacter harae]MCQ4164362.1 riboflavin synthase [Tahibacter harae]
MFTGIIQSVGRVRAIEPVGGDVRLVVDTAELDLSDVRLGDSIAVDGVCLTAVALDGASFAADVSRETLNCTTLGAWAAGRRVNLEKALRLADRLGGHLVSGHVDGVGEVVSVLPEARSLRWVFAVPAALARYIAAKGSIAVNGVSLTVNEVDGRRFGVNLIPHTLEKTGFGDCAVGSAVNIEVDLMARYAERLSSEKAAEA